MNAAAFRRSDALTRLEHYAYVTVEHLALIAWFPHHPARNHWDVELTAFKKALTRYDSGKGNKHNFSVQLITDVLTDVMETNEDKDYVLIGVESHGVVLPEEPDWNLLQEALRLFATEIVG